MQACACLGGSQARLSRELPELGPGQEVRGHNESLQKSPGELAPVMKYLNSQNLRSNILFDDPLS